ncbi:alanine--glyoxylate aminotransferase family protein [Conexibacter sp. CPCC 206217]|uniref:pyridoxal-phosphate-dependent aminotransferase family protein n=1 Tax=Conexibacter sp. CPCC 206217 TaxID=3064574 RepID=UPI002724A2F6|nr:alanine--glyoxylate aminotransferase family protein [Conexibacter sp. CPCC 206217]MDO8212518.1 alanine--glyoxylate aminotransferase family protein [Conexibacter sp. CPCC 206217]
MAQTWLTPGPTPVPAAVLEAQGRHPVFHRGRAFQLLLSEVTEGLQWLLETSNEVLLYTASGTGALEAAIVNCFAPGERIVVCVNGFFGERVVTIATRAGLVVERLDYRWGEAVRADDVAACLARTPDARGVVLQHSETSTSVVNDLAAIAPVVTAAPSAPLLMVDAVSAAGALPIGTDRLALDLVVGASQKALGATPGVSFVAVGARAWARHGELPPAPYYWDFSEYRRWARPGTPESPYTPAISVIEGLAAALRGLREQGLDAVFALHRLNAAAVKAGVAALGLEPFGENIDAGVVVTAVRAPPGVDPSALAAHLETRYGVVVAAGQGPLSADVLRVGHLGSVSAADVVAGIAALEAALADFGGPQPTGAGVAAVVQTYRKAGSWPGR